MPKSKKMASWPPHTQSRIYWYSDEEKVPENLKGGALPSQSYVDELHKKDQSEQTKRLKSTRIFTNLPEAFFDSYLTVQTSDTPFMFPKLGENKNITIRECLKKHDEFANASGRLHPSRWQQLGWTSQKAYDSWLDSSMLFAFSHCNHYCTVDRIFDADEARNETDSPTFHFKQTPTDAPHKKTNIYSVTGFEYRGFKTTPSSSIESTLPDVKAHSKITMQQILLAAKQTDTTDIVLIPFGMGVFIKGLKQEGQIKEAMIQGMQQALSEYDGPPVKIQCCGSPEYFRQLAQAKNANIRIIDRCGEDAYTVANDIQDRGDELGEIEDNDNERTLKSMLINAGDNDWTALLDPTKTPGQYYKGHTLYFSTSDEYYALVTDFAYYSIQNLKRLFGDLLEAKKITQLGNLENRYQPDLSKSGLFATSPIQANADFVNYFGSHQQLGLFNEYLNKRAEKYAVKDFFSNLIAFVLGCFGYQTDQALRESYIHDLQKQSQTYFNNSADRHEKEQLEAKIKHGLTHFPPRSQPGKQGYDDSLHALLTQFKRSIEQPDPSLSKQP
jgi:hypothetical protein